jgi:hypothetical protein
MIGPGELDHDRPKGRGDERIGGMIGQAHGQKAENEVIIVPVPDVLMEHRKEDKDDDKGNSGLFHKFSVFNNKYLMIQYLIPYFFPRA